MYPKINSNGIRNFNSVFVPNVLAGCGMPELKRPRVDK
jgi:hypothetical protein